jgi:hypothetical protein
MQLFFTESRNFAARNQQLFDFIHTSSVALWNLRWQVQGFVGARPDASADELSGRFASGTDIRANNIKGTIINTSWEDQLDQFAQVVAVNLIAMYEGWAEELMSKFSQPNLSKRVQWPSRGKYGNLRDGISEALAQAKTDGISNEMKQAFYPVYSANRKYSLSHLDALLALYRYHKEIRNSMMHRGGVADTIAENARRQASTLNRSDIGLRSSPDLSTITVGQIVKMNIGQAIQLSDVLLRIVATIDAELCFTSYAEKTFLDGWRSNQRLRDIREVPGDAAKKERALAAYSRKAGFVSPANTDAIYTIGRREGLLAY